MNILFLILAAAAVFGVAYLAYGRLLSRAFELDDSRTTPAVQVNDGKDFVPARAPYLLAQHFSAIAAAGPIVGPILAGLWFGWLPAFLWIVAGAILVGGVHDFASLVASIRHRARTIAEVVKEHVSPRAYLLFLAFVWIALVYVIVAFTDVTASSFVNDLDLGDGQVAKGGAVASSSLAYLALAVAMGICVKKGMRLGTATAIFLPLVVLIIAGGRYLPLTLPAWGSMKPVHQWDLIILGYCVVASLIPVWILLQPRGYLGGYFLYGTLVAGFLGLVFGGFQVNYPAILSPEGKPLFPVLFITIACGACSGFHALVSSGTTSKQLRVESDARSVGYGGMLLEGTVAVMALSTVMMLSADPKTTPDKVYAMGLASFLGVFGLPKAIGVSFGLLAFATFVYDTLDVCTRLGRYVLQEMTGLMGRVGAVLATLATAGVPAWLVTKTMVDPVTGKEAAAWRVFWNVFGTSNQLLAALTLMGITVWLFHTARRRGTWLLTGLPALFMFGVTIASLWGFVKQPLGELAKARTFAGFNVVSGVCGVLTVLAVLLLIEAVLAFARPPRSRPQVA